MSCSENEISLEEGLLCGRCPSSHPYISDNYCYGDCPVEYTSKGAFCINGEGIIPRPTAYPSLNTIYEVSRLDKCKPSHPVLIQGKCYSKCPSGTIPNVYEPRVCEPYDTNDPKKHILRKEYIISAN